MRVLVLEDDPDLCPAYADRLRREHLAVDEVSVLSEARRAIINADYDCLVLDRYVPGGDALDLVAELVQDPHAPPILIVSGDGCADARIEGLSRGADDYVSKPVRLDELVARVLRLLARAHQDAVAASRVVIGTVCLDIHRREVTVAERPTHLSPQQYSVLEYLMLHDDRIVTTTELIEHCWDCTTDMFSNPVHSQITRLRKILRSVLEITSVHAQGYRISAVTERGDRQERPR